MSLIYTMIVIFVLGYLMIAMEHKVNVSKSSVALVLCCLLWAILSVFSSKIDPSLTHDVVSSDLLAALGSTCEIIVFLIGAMTIVDIIDTHGGFEVITRHITTRKKTRLMWLIAFLTFFMSSVLDNMTTTIIMVMLIRRMLSNYKERWLFASIIIIAANCGGAWSPIGDVTTIMLWMKGNVGTAKLMASLILPCLVSVVIPTAVIPERYDSPAADQRGRFFQTFLYNRRREQDYPDPGCPASGHGASVQERDRLASLYERDVRTRYSMALYRPDVQTQTQCRGICQEQGLQGHQAHRHAYHSFLPGYPDGRFRSGKRRHPGGYG